MCEYLTGTKRALLLRATSAVPHLPHSHLSPTAFRLRQPLPTASFPVTRLMGLLVDGFPWRGTGGRSEVLAVTPKRKPLGE